MAAWFQIQMQEGVCHRHEKSYFGIRDSDDSLMNGSTERLWRRAKEYLAQRQLVPARIALESVIARDPADVRALLFLGDMAWNDDRIRDSVRYAVEAARVVPDEPERLIAVIGALYQLGEYALARELLERPCLLSTNDPGLLEQLAGLQRMLGAHQVALALLERARAAGLDGPEARFNLASELSINGLLAAAEAELERCVAMEETHFRAYPDLARIRRQTPERNHLALFDQRLSRATPGSLHEASIQFARYKELEDLGRYSEAWSALAHANALIAARANYEPEREQRLHDKVREVFTADFAKPASDAREGPTPIFVIGMTRSGTTLLERIMGNHSQVQSAGECEDFGWQLRLVAERCTQEPLDEVIVARLRDLDYAELGHRYLAQTRWRAQGKPYFVDKQPWNWRLAGLIRRALPNARILNTVRDPMDVCFSNFRVLMGDVLAPTWGYQLSTLAHYYLEYQKLMAHWHAVMPGQILDVNYAELVRDPESAARRAFAFCGLDYEEGCLDLKRNTTAVATLSQAQVRDKIHANAFEEWRPYEAQLAGLRAALGE